MRRRKKQLLGLGGLAVVAAMTGIAIALPAPDAEAMSTEISVTVTGASSPSASMLDIKKPLDREVVMSSDGSPLEVETAYQNVDNIVHNVTCTTSAGVVVTREIDSYAPTTANGVRSFSYDMSQLNVGTQASCVLKVEGRNSSGAVLSDEVSFLYRALKVSMDVKDTNKDGDPTVEVLFSDQVVKITLQVYDSNGRAVFQGANGEDESIILNSSDLDYTTLLYKGFLPMSRYNAAAGEYDLVVMAYDASGRVISLNPIHFKYGGYGVAGSTGSNAPNVPGTGNVFGDLNISRVDYLVTGLIVFGTVAGFGIYLIVRKNRERR